jgi:hypothetical protein
MSSNKMTHWTLIRLREMLLGEVWYTSSKRFSEFFDRMARNNVRLRRNKMTHLQLRIGRDFNGNKIVKVKIPGGRGWSIQTNGNLPKTHSTNHPDVEEILDYIKTYGTHRQKELAT